jgi:hypothetical protein
MRRQNSSPQGAYNQVRVLGPEMSVSKAEECKRTAVKAAQTMLRSARCRGRGGFAWWRRAGRQSCYR